MEFRNIDGERYIGGMHLVLQCHHYNALLCQTLILAPDFDGRELLFNTSTEEFHLLLQEVVRQRKVQGTAALLTLAEEVYRTLGLGVLDFSQIGPDGGDVVSVSSHMATACLTKWGQQAEPADDFGRAFTAATWALAYDRAIEDCTVTQVRCAARGDSEGVFRLEVIK